MTPTARRRIIYAMIVTLAGIVACVVVAAASACACPIPPAPVPCARLYLPTVQRNAPAMSAEFAPWVPVPTVTPEVPVSGDVQN